MTDRCIRINVFPKPDMWPQGRRYRAACYHLVLAQQSDVSPQSLAKLLHDPVIETVQTPTQWHGRAKAAVADVCFAPGVTDNCAKTAQEALVAAGYGQDLIAVYTGTLFMVDDEADAASLYNPLIERCQVMALDQARGLDGLEPKAASVHIQAQALAATTVDLGGDDAALLALSKRGCIDPASGKPRGPLGLSLADMKAIRAHFYALGRAPSDIEIETLAQSWSEHCKHRILGGQIDDIKQGLFKHYIARATHEILARPDKQGFCLSVFHDNAGAIVFDDDWMICDKVETHNSPSALDPYGGAMTGVVGVNRDCLGFGLGAKPIANRYGFCLANPDDDRALYRDCDGQSALPSAQAIEAGVIRGIEDGGNQSGIPTPLGFFVHDPRYRGKPLVFAGTVGLLPRRITADDGRQIAPEQKAAKVGDRIVMVGGRVGQDGIHGATFSSVALDSDSPATAVQIGDPITQKRLSDVLLYDLRDRGLYNAITDNGAGGLSSSIGEMAQDSGGAVVNLDAVPTKYPGLSPWEIWISESQERMSLAVPPANLAAVLAAFRKRGVEATNIGEFTQSGSLELKWHGQTLGQLSMDFLHNGAPKKVYVSKPSVPPTGMVPDVSDQQAARALMASPTLAPRQDVAQLFDHEVQGTSVVKPLVGVGRQPSQASVIAPVLGSAKAVGLSHALFPWMTETDPYGAALYAVDTAVRNLVAVGVSPDKIALQDNFCWCDPEAPERLWQLKQAAKGCYEGATHFGAPYISGKDSMFNDFRGFDANGKAVAISALPTLLISSIGVVDDVAHVQTLDFKLAGDSIYLVGAPASTLAGSLLSKELSNQGGEVYPADARHKASPEVLTCAETLALIHTHLVEGKLASVSVPGAGGLFHALLTAARAGGVGARIDDFSALTQSLLFGDVAGCLLVTAGPQVTLEASFTKIGEVIADASVQFGNRLEVAI